MKRRYYFLAFFACVLIALSCNDNSTSTEPPSPPENPDRVSKNIGPNGGEITSKDGSLILTIPAGALGNTETITIEPISPDELGSQFDEIKSEPGIKKAYELGPDGTQFKQPVTINMVSKQIPAQEKDSLTIQAQFLFTITNGSVAGLDSLRTVINLDERKVAIQGATTHFSPLIFTNPFSDVDFSVAGVRDEHPVGVKFQARANIRVDSELTPTDVLYNDFSEDPVLSDLGFDQIADLIEIGEGRYSRSIGYTCGTVATGQYRAFMAVLLPDDQILFSTLNRVSATLAKEVDCISPFTIEEFQNENTEDKKVGFNWKIEKSSEIEAEDFACKIDDGTGNTKDVPCGKPNQENPDVIEGSAEQTYTDAGTFKAKLTVNWNEISKKAETEVTVKEQAASVITEVNGILTDPFTTNLTVTGTYDSDLSTLSGTFNPDDGNEQIEIDLKNMSGTENGFIGEFDYAFSASAMYPINPTITVKNTQTDESDTESIEVDKVTLTARKNGAGKGTVTGKVGDVEPINCNPECAEDTADFALLKIRGTTFSIISLRAEADQNSDSFFLGWNSEAEDETGCEGFGDCELEMNQDRTVTATFEAVVASIVDLTARDRGNLTAQAEWRLNYTAPAGASLNCMMDWGDGTEEEQVDCGAMTEEDVREGEAEHTYDIAGTYRPRLTIGFEDFDASDSAETEVTVEEPDSVSDACLQPFGLNGDQALGLRFLTANISGFLGGFVNVECTSSTTLQLTEVQDETSDVNITCNTESGDCRENNNINDTALTLGVEASFGNQFLVFDGFEPTSQGDIQRTAQYPVGPKPQPQTIVAGNTYSYEAPNLIVNADMPERCGSGFNDSDARGAGNGLDFEVSNGTLSGLFRGQETAFEGPYSPLNGLWEASATLPFGEGEITRTFDGVFQQQPDEPVILTGRVTVEISDPPDGQLDGCIYSGVGVVTNRE